MRPIQPLTPSSSSRPPAAQRPDRLVPSPRPRLSAPRAALGLVARALVPALAGALLACGGDGTAMTELGEVGELVQPITNGAAYAGHPAVGRLAIQTRGGLREQCTGTLVGAHTVLTAAHCVVDAAQLAFELTLPATEAARASQGGAAEAVRRYAVEAVKVHPEYRADQPNSPDLALVWLPQAPGVAPLMVGAQAPTLGQPITLVGYGQTGSATADGGIKRMTTNAVAAVEPTLLAVVGAAGGRGNFCLGDSGGPVLATVQGQEAVIGVNSFLIKGADGSPCTDDGRAVRVDSYLGWISGAAGGDLALLAYGVSGDALPPEVTIVTPATGVAVGSRVIVRARVRDNVAVREAVLLLDGQLAGRVVQAPYDFPVQLTPGAHTLVIVAQDAVGNRAQASVAVEGGATGEQGEVAGCAVGAAGAASPRALSLGVLALLALLRRRRRSMGRRDRRADGRQETGCLGVRRA